MSNHYRTKIFRNDEAVLLEIEHGRENTVNDISGNQKLLLAFIYIVLIGGALAILTYGLAIPFVLLATFVIYQYVHRRQYVLVTGKYIVTETRGPKMSFPGKRLLRMPELRLFKENERYFLQQGKFKFPVSFDRKSETAWIVAELEKFLAEVPCDETAVAGKKFFGQFPSARLAFENGETGGERLEKVLSPLETCDPAEFRPLHGIPVVRCIACNAAVPAENLFLSEGIGFCPHCESVFETAEFKAKNDDKELAKYVKREGDTLVISQKYHRAFNIFSALIVMFLPFMVGFIMPAMILARTDISGEEGQIYELLFTYKYGFPFVYGILAIAAVLLFTIPTVLWILFERREIRIGPESCVLKWRVLFVKSVETIPRTSLEKFLVTGTRDGIPSGGMLTYRLANAKCLRRFNISIGPGMFRTINEYLMQVPPAESVPYDDPVEAAYFYGVDEIIEPLVFHCPECGACLPYKNIAQNSGQAVCAACSHRFSWKEELSHTFSGSAMPISKRLFRERTDAKLSFGQKQNTSKSAKADQYSGIGCVGAILVLCVVMFGGVAINDLFGGNVDCNKRESDLSPLFVAVFFGGLSVVALAFLTVAIISMWNELRALDFEWAFELDAEKAELNMSYKGITEHLTIPRAEIIEAVPTSGRSPKTLFGRYFSRKPAAMHGGPISLRLGDGKTLELPGFALVPGFPDQVFIENLIGELNGFLESHK